MRSCLWHSQANLQETASTSVARPPEAGLQSPDYSVTTRPLITLALVLVDEEGQVHVQLVNVVGGAGLRPVVEHLCERDNFPRSDFKTRARGSGGPADQQRSAATLIQNPIDLCPGEPLFGML